MQSTKLRAIIASENPVEQNLLTEVIEREQGVVVVGHAKNALKAVALARHLRPEVVLVDSRLPNTLGLDTVRLSRISGFDTATAISRELPRSLVVLLPNMNVLLHRELEFDKDAEAYLYIQTLAANVPIRLRELYNETTPSSSMVFANIEARERTSYRSKFIEICDKATLFSGIASLGGLALIVSIVLAGAGAVLTIGGVAGLLFSLTGRALATYWPKRRRIGYKSLVAEAIQLKEAKIDRKADAQRISSL